MTMHRCEWCQEETATVLPVVDRDPTSFQEHVLVCPSCADTASFEHTSLWNVKLFHEHGKVLLPSFFEAA